MNKSNQTFNFHQFNLSFTRPYYYWQTQLCFKLGIAIVGESITMDLNEDLPKCHSSVVHSHSQVNTILISKDVILKHINLSSEHSCFFFHLIFFCMHESLVISMWNLYRPPSYIRKVFTISVTKSDNTVVLFL